MRSRVRRPGRPRGLEDERLRSTPSAEGRRGDERSGRIGAKRSVRRGARRPAAAAPGRPAGLAALLGLVLGGAVAGCGEVDERIRIVFSDARTRPLVTELTVTAFEPFVEAQGRSRFLGCAEVGVFSPTSELAPEDVAVEAGVGRVFLDNEPFGFEPGFERDLSFPRPESTARNPWGAVMVVIEGRGNAVTSFSRGGAEELATLATGCYCFRTREGSHPDRALDQAVRAACAATEEGTANERVVELGPVVPRGFRLELCHTDQVTTPPTEEVLPGPTACLRTTLCASDPIAQDCFECEGACTELQDLANVPVAFEVVGDGITPERTVVVTNTQGEAEARLNAAACSGDFEVVARVVGRSDEVVRFPGTCVPSAGPFRCRTEARLGGRVHGLSTLPGPAGGPDRVVLVEEGSDGEGTTVRVLDPSTGATLDTAEVLEEPPKAVLGFDYQRGRGRPMVAVATTRELEGSSPVLVVRVYDWDGVRLTETATLAEPCALWTCGPLTSCAEGCRDDEACLVDDGVCVRDDASEDCPSGPAGCGCRIEVAFGNDVNLVASDLDGDGRVDLSAASSGSVPITTWLSSQGGPERPYAPGGCRCGSYGTNPLAFAIADVGGPGADPRSSSVADLVIASSGGALVVYGRPTAGVSALQCGRGRRFGAIVSIQDVVAGRFACRPELDLGCPAYGDLAVVAAPEGATGSFENAGYVRVIFGSDRDFASYTDLFEVPETHADLSAQSNALRAAVGDLNGDGHDDLAVVDGSPGLQVWLGRSNRGLGRLPYVDMTDCEVSDLTEFVCRPLDALALPDTDGDGRREMVVVCDPSNSFARLRWYAP